MRPTYVEGSKRDPPSSQRNCADSDKIPSSTTIHHKPRLPTIRLPTDCDSALEHAEYSASSYFTCLLGFLSTSTPDLLAAGVFPSFSTFSSLAKGQSEVILSTLVIFARVAIAFINQAVFAMAGRSVPQAATSSYAPRLRTYNNSLLAPVIHNAPANPLSRTTKRGTTAINYAEDGYDDYDDDEEDTRRRPTGLRSLRRDDSAARGAADQSDKVGKETEEPVQVQGIWRDWIGKNQGRNIRSDHQNHAQSLLPQTLIPIRVDVDIPAWAPPPAIPAPHHPSIGIAADPAYRPGETTVPYRLKDFFLWNLHETLITTDQFAMTLVQDLDLPNRNQIAAEISKQIRTQLEEYAGVALHPLFHTTNSSKPTPAWAVANRSGTPATPAQGSRSDTPVGGATSTPGPSGTAAKPAVEATASMVMSESSDYNPDDTYRCIINLSINLSNELYTDKFEWSLLHPPGTAEMFARTTCADMGLAGEWIPAMTHAIYEAVLKLKKEACELGGMVQAFEMQNDTVIGSEAGWRYDPENLGLEWEPKIEKLSKEEIEKREGDRERQLRRLRRETARFSSNTGMVGGLPNAGSGLGGPSFNALIEAEEERMGRGERNKKKRRFRSLSPLGRSGTPGGGRGTPDVSGSGGYGGGGETLADGERNSWRCSHCKVWGTCVWAVRDGPHGPKYHAEGNMLRWFEGKDGFVTNFVPSRDQRTGSWAGDVKSGRLHIHGPLLVDGKKKKKKPVVAQMEVLGDNGHRNGREGIRVLDLTINRNRKMVHAVPYRGWYDRVFPLMKKEKEKKKKARLPRGFDLEAAVKYFAWAMGSAGQFSEWLGAVERGTKTSMD
ncbi:RSC complex subunit Sfh1 [Zalerion maritima]|uniref:RSC complex subunit Sfh1 n=1 Tax=Zalerion maritima TaxID=339359 RepID=A0AAD5WUR4_9PEZI|nr:RSC complex subunit Sfh1 [Zalerion maritima]